MPELAPEVTVAEEVSRGVEGHEELVDSSDDKTPRRALVVKHRVVDLQEHEGQGLEHPGQQRHQGDDDDLRSKPVRILPARGDVGGGHGGVASPQDGAGDDAVAEEDDGSGGEGLEDRVEHQEVGGGVEQGLSVICFYPLQVGHVVLRVVTAD